MTFFWPMKYSYVCLSLLYNHMTDPYSPKIKSATYMEHYRNPPFLKIAHSCPATKDPQIFKNFKIPPEYPMLEYVDTHRLNRKESIAEGLFLHDQA